MKNILIALLILSAGGAAMAESLLYDLKVKSIDGKELPLSTYKGKTLLFVNTASKCGFTPQYDGLEKLYTQYKDRGLVILGFPSNDFGAQEPGSNAEIKTFCKANFGVTFPLFEKSVVTGTQKNPVFQKLLAMGPDATEIKWNFEKFLVDPAGRLVSRFRSKVEPQSSEMIKTVEKTLPH